MSALDREKARDVLSRYSCAQGDRANPILDALEACVVADPRIARIEALMTTPDERGIFRWKVGHARRKIRAILRDES